MTSLEGLIVIDKDSDLAVYLQIANCIIHGIRSGRLRRGSRLAGSRRSKRPRLSVHRKTMNGQQRYRLCPRSREQCRPASNAGQRHRPGLVLSTLSPLPADVIFCFTSLDWLRPGKCIGKHRLFRLGS